MASKRITITISNEDELWLDGYCRVQQISLAEAIRRGICLLKEAQRQETYRHVVESTSGLWKKETV